MRTEEHRASSVGPMTPPGASATRLASGATHPALCSTLSAGGTETPRSASRRKRGERGVWQRRFWDHEGGTGILPVNLEQSGSGILPVKSRHMDYIHYNPVKHGLSRCPHAWPHSSFAKWVCQGTYAADWMCLCAGRPAKPPDFGDIEGRAGE